MAISSKDRLMILRSQNAQKASHDPHRQVGVVIANNKNQIVSVGTNAPPASFGLDPVDSRRSIVDDAKWKYYMLEHAERNAIFTALKNGYSLDGATMYGTLYPCADCARAIAAAGIRRVVVPKAGIQPERDEKWLEHYKYAQKVFALAGIEVDYFSENELHNPDTETYPPEPPFNRKSS